MRKTKILVILIILIGLGVGGFFVYQNFIIPEAEREIEVPPAEERVEVLPEEMPPEEEAVAPPEEEETETPITPKEKLACLFQCCINETYKSKTCPFGYECKENKCVEIVKEELKKELKFEWVKDDGIRISDGSVPYAQKLKDGGIRLYYCGQGGILSAISSDGLNFQKEPGVRIANTFPGEVEAMICDPTIVELLDDKIRMYYKGANGSGGPGQAVHKIFSAISFDGLNFQKEGLRIDSEKTGDRGWASVPEVIKLSDGRVRIYYVSDALDVRHGIVSAISADGLNFIKEETKLTGLVDPAIITLPDGKFLFLAVAMAFGPGGIRPTDAQSGIYSFISNDGIHFENRQLVLLQEGALDPSIIKITENIYRVFYGEIKPPNPPIVKSITGYLK